MIGLNGQSVDLVVTDPPFGVTKGEEIWRASKRPVADRNELRGESRDPNNLPVDWETWWVQIRRVVKPGGAVVIMGVQPFFTEVIQSNRRDFKYDWIWEKGRVTGALNAKIRPMTGHVGLAVFGIGGRVATYNPQGRPEDPTKNPKSVIRFSSVQRARHFSEKPVPLMEYMVLTYSNPGDVVLDPFMGSGTTGVAAVRNGRIFIGIDVQRWCVDTAAGRIEAERGF